MIRVLRALPALAALSALLAHAGCVQPEGVDGAGREPGPTAPPTRIISLIPATTELVVALGAGERLVARTDYDLDPALAALPSVGQGLTPSIEWLTSLRPDLVIAWPDSRDRGVTARLAELGIPVYSAAIESLDDIVSTTLEIGDLLGLPAAADSLVAAIEAGFDEVRRTVEGRGRPVVFYVVGHDPPMTAAPGTFIDELIDLAGARNLFADLKGWPQVSLEEVLHRQPDILIVPSGEGNETVARLSRRPGWRELDAIRAGRVHSIDALIAHRPGPRIAEVARMLAELIHPDAFDGEPTR